MYPDLMGPSGKKIELNQWPSKISQLHTRSMQVYLSVYDHRSIFARRSIIGTNDTRSAAGEPQTFQNTFSARAPGNERQILMCLWAFAYNYTAGFPVQTVYSKMSPYFSRVSSRDGADCILSEHSANLQVY
jgi:hypothetical protein